jgi:hypothetical protein
VRVTACLFVTICVLTSAGCGGGQEEPSSSPSSAPKPQQEAPASLEPPTPFVPSARREAGQDILPLAFPDGTTAELVYPWRLGLAPFGATPYSSGTLHGRSEFEGRSDFVGRDFLIRHDNVDDLLRRLNGGVPPVQLAEYAGAAGSSVGLWDIEADDDANYLGFQFGSWAVLVYDYAAGGSSAGAQMTDAERADWAQNFTGSETANGFLLLAGSGPLRLARAGDHAGPQLLFTADRPSKSFALYPGPCRPHRDQDRVVAGMGVQWSRGFADWCASEEMRVHAYGGTRFIETLLRDLEVRNVLLGPGSRQ